MKNGILLLLLICVFHGYGQYIKYIPAKDTVGKRGSVSFNPLGLLEPQLAVGLGLGYMLNDRMQVWLESSVLSQGVLNFQPVCLIGYREVLALKRYLGPDKNFFVAMEFRWKQTAYRDAFDFINPATGDVLTHYSYKVKNTVMGFGGWWGLRRPLSKDNRLALEMNMGFGLKYRAAGWTGVPDGYQYSRKADDNGFPFSASPRVQQLTFYTPIAFRVVYGLF